MVEPLVCDDGFFVISLFVIGLLILLGAIFFPLIGIGFWYCSVYCLNKGKIEGGEDFVQHGG